METNNKFLTSDGTAFNQDAFEEINAETLGMSNKKFNKMKRAIQNNDFDGIKKSFKELKKADPLNSNIAVRDNVLNALDSFINNFSTQEVPVMSEEPKKGFFGGIVDKVKKWWNTKNINSNKDEKIRDNVKSSEEKSKVISEKVVEQKTVKKEVDTDKVEEAYKLYNSGKIQIDELNSRLDEAGDTNKSTSSRPKKQTVSEKQVKQPANGTADGNASAPEPVVENTMDSGNGNSNAPVSEPIHKNTTDGTGSPDEGGQGKGNQGGTGSSGEEPKVKTLQERIKEIKDNGKKEGWTKKQTNARIKKEELDDAYTQAYEKYAPKWSEKPKKNAGGGKFPAGQDGKDDPANALMNDYDKAVEAKRKAVKNKDEKAYEEASKKMHEIAGSYSEKTGHDFRPDRQYWTRGKVSRYGGNTSKDLASFAARNPNSIEANIINNINNGNGLENLENLAGGYQDTIENLKRYGFNTNKIKKAATSYMKLSEAAAKNGLSTQVYETIQKGGKTEAYSVIDALKQKQTALGDKKGNILGQDPGKMQKLPKGELDNLDAIDKEQKELKTSISNAEKLFNKRFKGGIKGYEKLKEAERIHDRGIAEISDDLPVEKPTKTDIKEKGKYRAGFRKRMNEKLGYGRGGNIGWGKVAKAGVAAALVAGTVGLMMGSDKGQQTNGQLYGQQPIY